MLRHQRSSARFIRSSETSTSRRSGPFRIPTMHFNVIVSYCNGRLFLLLCFYTRARHSMPPNSRRSNIFHDDRRVFQTLFWVVRMWFSSLREVLAFRIFKRPCPICGTFRICSGSRRKSSRAYPLYLKTGVIQRTSLLWMCYSLRICITDLALRQLNVRSIVGVGRVS